MITIQELLSGNNLEEQSQDIKDNLANLLIKMNKIRDKYGKIMRVTSGLRSISQHLSIYSKKGIIDKSKIPMKSKHLQGLACDVYDPNCEVYNWCKQNEDFLKQLGVWLETRQGNWQHFQIVPFKSYKPGGTIWFNP